MSNLVGLLLLSPADAATLVGGDYAGADLVPADGDVLEGTFTNVGTFHVAAGVHVLVQDQVRLVVEADTILVEGHLDGNGAGYDGGTLEKPGKGPGAPEEGPGDEVGGGGAYGGAGGDGGRQSYTCSGDEAQGGDDYGIHDDPVKAPRGSGGGSSGCGKDVDLGDGTVGGDGGGSVTLRADLLTVAASGAISVGGGDGQDYRGDFACGYGSFYGGSGNGGGSGGSLVLDATGAVQIDGSLVAGGGKGGDAFAGADYTRPGGGGGGGGRVKIYGPVVGVIPEPDVTGGFGGQGDEDYDRECVDGDRGGRGTIYVDDWVTGPPSLTVSGSCGSVTAMVTGGTPFGRVQLITGASAGSDPLGAGSVCEGLVTGLSGLVKEGTRELDESGSITLSGVGPDCGIPFQVIDLWSCTTSPVVTLP